MYINRKIYMINQIVKNDNILQKLLIVKHNTPSNILKINIKIHIWYSTCILLDLNNRYWINKSKFAIVIIKQNTLAIQLLSKTSNPKIWKHNIILKQCDITILNYNFSLYYIKPLFYIIFYGNIYSFLIKNNEIISFSCRSETAGISFSFI